jgi:hypothetical protein
MSVSDLRRKKVGDTAHPPVANCHPHRFRDTFAVSLLLKGVSLQSVSVRRRSNDLVSRQLSLERAAVHAELLRGFGDSGRVR